MSINQEEQEQEEDQSTNEIAYYNMIPSRLMHLCHEQQYESNVLCSFKFNITHVLDMKGKFIR